MTPTSNSPPGGQNHQLTLVGALTRTEMADLVQLLTEGIRKAAATKEATEADQTASRPNSDEAEHRLETLRRRIADAVQDYVRTCGSITVKSAAE